MADTQYITLPIKPKVPPVKIQVVSPPVHSKPAPTLVLTQAPSAPTVVPPPAPSPASSPVIIPMGPGNIPTDRYVPRAGLVVHGNYSAMMNQTNIAANANKFYLVQVLTDPKTRTYFVYKRYGRTGEKGIVNLQAMSNEACAVGEFKAVFQSKTGNQWGGAFVAKPNKYVLMHIEAPQIVQVKAVPAASMLPEKISAFIAMISNRQMFERSLESMEIDPQRMPLGKISHNQLDAAEAILKSIENSVRTHNPDLVTLSSQFWTVIPFATKRNRPPPVIDTEEHINRASEMLDTLRHISVAGTLLERQSNLDDIYKSLGTDMSVVDPHSSEWGQILTYITNTHAPTHKYRLRLVNLFRLNKSSQDAADAAGRFKKVGNHRLLFHGSKMTNFVGILSEGLRLPKPDQIANGAMLGPAIYFADSISKSFNYTCSNETGGRGFVLVCEVALGNMEEATRATKTPLPTGFDSRWGVGKSVPDTQGNTPWVVDPTVIVPCGRLTQTNVSSSLLYNEHVIFNREQYRLRYIMELESE